jgi:hypothetical protein
MGKQTYEIYSYAVNTLDVELYNECLDKIIQLAKNKKPIPNGLVTKLSQLIHSIDLAKNDVLISKYIHVTLNATEYFSKCANGIYNFEGTNIKAKEGEPNHYSIHNMFILASRNYYKNEDKKELEYKEGVLQFFYKEIIGYRDLMFSKKHLKECKHYKMAVMAAYLTELVGYKMTPKKKPNNTELFQSTKNILKEFKTKKTANK